MPASPDPLRHAVSLHLREWLTRHPGEMESLACQLGVSVGAVSMWATGSRFPGSVNLAALADALGMPLCRLLCVGDSASPACQAANCPECRKAAG